MQRSASGEPEGGTYLLNGCIDLGEFRAPESGTNGGSSRPETADVCEYTSFNLSTHSIDGLHGHVHGSRHTSLEGVRPRESFAAEKCTAVVGEKLVVDAE